MRAWLAAPLLAVTAFAAPVPAWVVEQFYARDAYPWLQAGVTRVSNLVPFAVLDVLIGMAAALGLYRLVRLMLTARRSGLFSAVWEGVRRVLRAAAVLLLAFLSIWGCNYRREPIAVTGDPAPQTTTALRLAIADANRLAAALRADDGLVLEVSYAEAAADLTGPMNQALERIGRLPMSVFGRPKSSRLLDPFFQAAGVSGMINPLALESIVQDDLLPVERGFVLAHEWAHLAGQADEAEASAVGWLACMHGSPALVYSASLYLIMQAASALPAGEYREVRAELDPAVRADIDAIIRRTLRQERPEVQRAATRVYDEYLKANDVSDGTASYGRALTLILSPSFRDALDAAAARLQPSGG